LSTLDEKNLIERTQAGNPEAFSPLVEKYHHHELPIKVIACRLKRSEGTIKTHLRNARRDLRDLLSLLSV
jgi:DNA-directed RNA polymerase specialized sigma24 family protein